ncbi:BZ3500_MvSof-1268-A1-R1_Chr2-1g04421 [Microbotryum saponariae]|uniref:BZ3500_MvSof-1268-A1-R1_Chr2-1g04421 protein n=1 Tax=Microbotryum saponariae TaxID=289078 RepID=A0A2X0L764_9BASI|nr:BZ3500_MvSof-1268-A1-R1_Chr2-1g04421 [Microbotryum saponariae]SCZ91653.1 BZ3501_MvSof-1269-A2-R1_Chr2-1g04077 [Microbotryum saponariae]
MQFPKAKRFASPTPDDVPPVGAYSIEAPLDPNYKRGPMRLTDKRFHDPNVLQQPDTFGLYDPADKENPLKRPRSSAVAGNGLERMRQQMDELKTRISNQHEKELAKLQGKISRLEASREEGVKERQEMSKELLSLKSELRSTTTREQTLAGKLGKAEASLSKYQTLLPTLQTKLDQLTTSHADSRKRKDDEITELKDKIEKKNEELSAAKDEAKELRRAAREERWARQEMSRVGEKTVREVWERTRASSLANRLEHGKIIATLQADLLDRESRLEEETTYCEELRQELEVAEELLEDAHLNLERLMEERARDRQETRAEKDWRQRARSDQRDAAGLRNDVAHLDRCIELDQQRAQAATWLHDTLYADLRAQILEHEKELEIVEGELDMALNDEIPRLEEACDLANEGLEEMRDRVLELQETLGQREGEVEELQARAIAEIERFEGSLEEERRRYADKEKEVEKERTEKRRIASLLGQARSAEAALVEERDLLLAELHEAESLRMTHQNLVANLDYLARENAATREDNVLLVEQNAELASHQNSRQKIQVHAATRAQLADSRRVSLNAKADSKLFLTINAAIRVHDQAHLAVTSKLATSEARIVQLQSELQAYKSVSSLPFTTTSTMIKSTGRTKVTRPVLLPLEDLPPAPTPMGSILGDSMPPPRLPIPRSTVSFAPSNVYDGFEASSTEGPTLVASSRAASRKTPRLTLIADEEDVRHSEDGGSRSRRMSNGGVRMTGKMSLSELI